MPTPRLALFIIFCISSFISRFGFCYDESPWQPSYDYYHIDLGEIGGHHGGLGSKAPLPRDVMVDVINELGVKLLAIHNENNENNIALSPYGALSVLAALTEGLQGEAAHEILHAAHIPADKHITRVGLRDIHRHLKSYFIPEEGFLAGLTLNLNNVTLRSEYEDVLRFYGFDYGSFNNALYPEPPTTQKPSQATTLGTTLGMFEGTTTGSPQTTIETTTLVTEAILNESTTQPSTTTEETTSKDLTTTQMPLQGKEETVTEELTTKVDISPETTTLPSSTTVASITTIKMESTTQTSATTVLETTTISDKTTIKESSSTSAATTEATTTQASTATEDSEKATKEPATDTVLITTKIAQITTKMSSTEGSTLLTEIITKGPETTTAMLTTEKPTTEIPLTTIESTATTKGTTSTTEALSTTTESVQTTTGSPETTSAMDATTTAGTTTIAASSVISTTTVPSESTTMTSKSDDTVRTTREISVNMMSTEQLTTVPVEESTSSELPTIPSDIVTSPEVTTLIAETTSTTIQDLTRVLSIDETTIPFVNPVVPFDGTGVQNEPINPPLSTPPQFFDEPQELETTTPFFFGTTPDFQDMTTFDPNAFDYNYNYDANLPLTDNTMNNTSDLGQVPPIYDDNSLNLVTNNLMTNTPEGASFNRNLKRRARSVVDYVIARYYDDHQPYAPPPQRPQYLPQMTPQRPQYIPQNIKPPERPLYVPQREPLTFAIYGKYRESGINFMKYDTALPFFYVANLNALALSFPLDSSKYYLLLLLPVEDNGVDQLICDLRLHGNLRHIIEHLRLTHVVATIPSFMLKGYVTLTPLLQRLGIRKIFEPRQADFSPMTNVTDIYVTNIEQAVTVTIRNYVDPSAQHYKNLRQYPPVQFKADHPFLYFVIDSELHVALMVGKVINPLNSRIR